MKKLISISFISLFFILLAGSVFGQSAFSNDLVKNKVNGYNTYYTEAVIDSVDTLTTGEISLDDGIEQIPVFQYKTFSSATGKPKVTVIRQEYRFGTWTDAKTLYTADSVETNYMVMPPDTLRAATNRYLIIGAAANRSDTSVKIVQRFKRIPN
jgi:hypothetical protein